MFTASAKFQGDQFIAYDEGALYPYGFKQVRYSVVYLTELLLLRWWWWWMWRGSFQSLLPITVRAEYSVNWYERVKCHSNRNRVPSTCCSITNGRRAGKPKD